MEKYGNKIVLRPDQFYEGIVVENTNEGKVVAREYYKNEYEEQMPGEILADIDYRKVATMKTPIEKMREITKQLGHGKFAISKDILEIIN